MPKRIEIELPEMTQDMAERFEKDNPHKNKSSIKFYGLNLLEYNLALNYGYTIIEPKYYIKVLKNNFYGYLNVEDDDFNKLSLHSTEESASYKTKFTEDEIKCNFPQFWECRKLVEDIGVNQCED